MDETTNDRYGIILGRDLLTAMVLDLKFYDKFIIGDDIPYEGCSVPMVDASNYKFKSVTDKTVKPEEYFIKSYVDKCLEYESVVGLIQDIRRILDSK